MALTLFTRGDRLRDSTAAPRTKGLLRPHNESLAAIAQGGANLLASDTDGGKDEVEGFMEKPAELAPPGERFGSRQPLSALYDCDKEKI